MRAPIALVLTVVAVLPAEAQGVGATALASVDEWKTDAGSQLLARNGGSPATTGSVYLWLAWQPAPSVQLIALADADAASGAGSSVEGTIDGFSLRWWRSKALRVDAGKILPPIGEFAARRFADVNPLIGSPDTYAPVYPWGATLSGASGALDYQASLVTLPAVNLRYSPPPSARLRPALGLGVRPSPALRLGVSATYGPYLGESSDAELSPAEDWTQYHQTVVAFDVHWSWRRVDAHGEGVWSSYPVPDHSAPVRGLGWYAESRYSLTPRWFVAARYEHNRYPFVRAIAPGTWIGVATTQMNGEGGVGYRLNASASWKVSLRRDHWPVHAAGGVSFPDGYALATELSWRADLAGWLTHTR